MASKAATHYLQFDIQWSSLALLFFDYALTFPAEVKYIWGSKLRLSTFLYIFCRYAGTSDSVLAYPIAQIQSHCDAWYKIIGALSVFGRAAVIVTFTGRTYAIYARNTYILIYLGLIGAACIVLDVMHVPGLRCVGSSSNPFLMAFKVGGRKQHSKGLINLIFEQGVLYFSIISLFTTAAVILNVEAPAGFFQRLLNAYTLPLSGLLTARFLLHIRAYERSNSLGAQTKSGAEHPSGTLASFRAAAGNTMSSMVDQFGEDPVEAAQRQTQGEASGMSMTTPASSSTDGPSEISLVRRESGSVQSHSGSPSAV
ncbi:DUF6533 domain-containing protein [Pleurotus pulmonarius]